MLFRFYPAVCFAFRPFFSLFSRLLLSPFFIGFSAVFGGGFSGYFGGCSFGHFGVFSWWWLVFLLAVLGDIFLSFWAVFVRFGMVFVVVLLGCRGDFLPLAFDFVFIVHFILFPFYLTVSILRHCTDCGLVGSQRYFFSGSLWLFLFFAPFFCPLWRAFDLILTLCVCAFSCGLWRLFYGSISGSLSVLRRCTDCGLVGSQRCFFSGSLRLLCFLPPFFCPLWRASDLIFNGLNCASDCIVFVNGSDCGLSSDGKTLFLI